MQLKVSNKQLVTEDGRLFFYTADTAWEIFHKLTLAEAKEFIDNRAQKGFNVIQAVAVAELDGLKTPTYEKHLLPFTDLEQLTVNEAYFDHVREVISYANSKGIFIALVPMWGSYIISNPLWGGQVKPIFNAQSAARFVTYLAHKFADLDIIWMLGGDRPYSTPERRDIIRGMAGAIRAVNGSRHLITVHTQGGCSAWDMLEQPDYLDFITWQSGHMGRCYPSWRCVGNDYRRLPIPVLDAEPCYESHPIMNEYTFSRSDCASRFTDYEVRRASYWSVFSGGAGITYGCYAIWQMHREEDEAIEIPESAASAYRQDQIPFYHQSLNFPGAFQIPYLKSFIEKLPGNLTLEPAQELLLSENYSDERHVAVLSNRSRDFIAAYVPMTMHICLDITAFGYGGFNIFLYDPRFNIYNRLSTDNSESQFLNITTPQGGRDFVVLLKRKGL